MGVVIDPFIVLSKGDVLIKVCSEGISISATYVNLALMKVATIHV
jgi:hypothetical protein